MDFCVSLQEGFAPSQSNPYLLGKFTPPPPYPPLLKAVDGIRQIPTTLGRIPSQRCAGMWRGVRNREEGRIHPHSFASRLRADRLASLVLSNRKEIVSPHRSSINSLQVSHLSLSLCNFIKQLVVTSLKPRACVFFLSFFFKTFFKFLESSAM